MVAQKIGDNAPAGAVFHNRRFTGEILAPNAPGRDPVITRIIWLRGLEAQNARAFYRCIYIHGTPEEKTIGRPASYGCIRMKSGDIAALYNHVPLGALVQIISDRLPKAPKAPPVQSSNTLTVQAEKAKEEQQLASTSASGSLTIEQMRMAGALAAERKKGQTRKTTPVPAVRVTLDNRDCTRERPRSQIFRLSNGQHEISCQAHPPDGEAIAS
jgi:hypothetical protein